MKYSEIYKQKNVWGVYPNKLLLSILDQLDDRKYFLDLGSGQGRDSLFMASRGFEVVSVDESKKAIDDLDSKAKDLDLDNRIKTFSKNLVDFDIERNKFDVINIINTLQFLDKKSGLDIIRKAKDSLSDDGYIIISGFTVLDLYFDLNINKKRCFFEVNELKNLFVDFDIIFYKECIVNDPGHAGMMFPHKHRAVYIIAKK